MRIVYVAGWLRSGTTMLTRMLGAVPGVVSLGEVSGVWDAAARGGRCSCGELISTCPVWCAGLQAVQARHGIGVQDYTDFAHLTRSVLRTRQSRRLSALRTVTRDRWPVDVQTYVGVLGTLLAALAEASGCETVVDSSKLPPGFLLESLLEGTRLDIVHILRDPRAVVNSELRSLRSSDAEADGLPPGRSVVKSAAYWSLGNLAIRRFAPRDALVTLTYEDLAAFPDHQLHALCRRLAIAIPPDWCAQLSVGHLAVGNPSRFDGADRKIEPDTAWRRELSPGRRMTVTGISAPARLLLSRGPDIRPER